MIRNICFVFLIVSKIIIAQPNLVKDGGIEYLPCCPLTNPNCILSDWDDFLNSPWIYSMGWSNASLYNHCFDGSNLIGHLGYHSWVGYQKAHSGIGYIGGSISRKFDNPNVIPNQKEYFIQKLPKPLEIGKKYFIKFYTCLADSSEWATNRIDLAFTDSVTILNNIPVLIEEIPIAIAMDTTIIMSDTANWHKISGIYTAKENDSWLVISNLHFDIHTIFSRIQIKAENSFGGRISEYLVDDVSIYEVTRSSKSTKKICQGTALKGRNNYKRYEWQNDDSLQTYVPTINGTYTVISYSDTSLVIDSFVVELQTPQSISISGDSICTQGTEVTLIAPPNYASYNWSTGATNQSIIIAPINTTVYTVMVTDEYGCEAIAKKELVVKPKPELSIIVPTLLIKSKTKLWQILNLPNNTNLSLYDLLGNEIMQTNNYLNNYDYSNLANAIYIYRLSTSDGIIKSGKIVVLE